MGPQREWGSIDRAVERSDFARPMGRLGTRPWDYEPCGLWEHCHQLFVVWRQHAEHRPAFLWFYGRCVQVADDFRGQPGGDHRTGIVAFAFLAQFSRLKTGSSSTWPW